MFKLLIESDPHLKPKKKALSLAVSVVLHGLILFLAVILPLFFTETLSPGMVVTIWPLCPRLHRRPHRRLLQQRS
jgi:hypothetical protein